MAGQGRAGKDSGWVLGAISHSPVTWAHHRVSGVGTVDRVGKSERWMNGRSHTVPFSSLHFKSDIIAGSLPSLSLWRRVGSFINPGLLPPHRMMQRFTQSRPPDRKIKDSMLPNNTAINRPLEFQSEPGWSQQYPYRVFKLLLPAFLNPSSSSFQDTRLFQLHYLFILYL